MLWLSSLSCYGNVHSFFNYKYIDKFLEDFEFVYHPSIESPYSLDDIATLDLPCDILLLEGTLEDDLKKGNALIKDLIVKYATKAKKILTVGTCASFGGVFLNNQPNRYGFLYTNDQPHQRFETFKEKTINISGCPIHPEALANTLYSIKNSYFIPLDSLQRPKDFYGYTVHNGCVRNEYFEYKIDSFKYGNLEGCMFYDHGCQGPFSSASCNRLLWNETSSKTRSGHPCLGCTEPSFPKPSLFQTQKNMGMPANMPKGVPKRAYIAFAGVAKAFEIKRFHTKIMEDEL
ncbi:MAG: hydrogenase [Campylobacterales bacterium]|nr:hydrogenase [Campylobacterales bacterium]